jgi:hypothetical protein
MSLLALVGTSADGLAPATPATHPAMAVQHGCTALRMSDAAWTLPELTTLQ